jgi:hypothetical protein
MKRLVLALFVLASSFFSAPAVAQQTTGPACIRENSCNFSPCYGTITGTVHYICDCATTGSASVYPIGQQPAAGCVAGSDSNNGTSKATPWKTYSKAEAAFSSMAAGDALLFCNGGVFDLTGASSNRFVNRNATSGNRVITASYGGASWQTGNEGRPLWIVPLGTYAVNLDDGSDIARGGYIFAGLALQGIGQPATPTESSPMCGGSHCPFEAFFVYDQINNVLVCDTEQAYFSIGMEMGGGNGASDDNIGIVERNNYLHHNEGQGFLGSGSNMELRNNYWWKNGYGTANLDHHLYLSGSTYTGLVVDGNEFYQAALVGGGGCAGAISVLHGLVAGLVFSHNLMHEVSGTPTPSCYAIGFNPGYTSFEGFSNITVDGNVIIDAGSEGIVISATHNGIVQNNVMIADSSTGFEAIALTNDGQGSGGGDWDNQSVTMRNNTAYGKGVSMRIANTGSLMSSYNNVVYETDSGTVTCFNYSLSDASYSGINNNVCYAPNATSTVWNGNGSQTRAAFCTNHGFDCASTVGSNPNFTNARVSTTYPGAIADFTPAVGSLLIAGGNAANAPTVDQTGASRPGTPAIGAIERLSTFLGGKGSFYFFNGM